MVRQKSARCRAQVRREARYLGETFGLRKDTEGWVDRSECDLDAGIEPASRELKGIRACGDLIDLHVADIKSVGKAPGRTE